MKKKTKKGSKKGMLKLKRGLLAIFVLFLMGGMFVNSKYFVQKNDAVYAQLKEKYGITVQTEPDVIEDNQVITNSNEKNYNLTVNSDLRIPSNVTAEEIDKMLSGTKLHGLGSAFVEAEQKYGVNALYMMGLACLESGYGSSNYAVKRNNLYGWNAVDSNPDNAKWFKSKEESTLYVASKLKANYLTVGGAYHEGFSARSVDVHYCTDKQHADKIVNIVNNLLEKLG